MVIQDLEQKRKGRSRKLRRSIFLFINVKVWRLFHYDIFKTLSSFFHPPLNCKLIMCRKVLRSWYLRFCLFRMFSTTARQPLTLSSNFLGITDSTTGQIMQITNTKVCNELISSILVVLFNKCNPREFWKYMKFDFKKNLLTLVVPLYLSLCFPFSWDMSSSLSFPLSERCADSFRRE